MKSKAPILIMTLFLIVIFSCNNERKQMIEGHRKITEEDSIKLDKLKQDFTIVNNVYFPNEIKPVEFKEAFNSQNQTSFNYSGTPYEGIIAYMDNGHMTVEIHRKLIGAFGDVLLNEFSFTDDGKGYEREYIKSFVGSQLFPLKTIIKPAFEVTKGDLKEMTEVEYIISRNGGRIEFHAVGVFSTKVNPELRGSSDINLKRFFNTYGGQKKLIFGFTGENKPYELTKKEISQLRKVKELYFLTEKCNSNSSKLQNLLKE
ncbi:MAG: hypothetical protein M3Q58_16330 [Bacteroidota bacterium]|nr:hypothetical protein [Bacteroidota bacterium]